MQNVKHVSSKLFACYSLVPTLNFSSRNRKWARTIKVFQLLLYKIVFNIQNWRRRRRRRRRQREQQQNDDVNDNEECDECVWVC